MYQTLIWYDLIQNNLVDNLPDVSIINEKIRLCETFAGYYDFFYKLSQNCPLSTIHDRLIRNECKLDSKFNTASELSEFNDIGGHRNHRFNDIERQKITQNCKPHMQSIFTIRFPWTLHPIKMNHSAFSKAI